VHVEIAKRDFPIGSGPSIIRGTRVRGSKIVGVRHIGVFEYIELLPPGIAIRDLPTRSGPSVQWTRGRDLHRRRKSRPGVKSVGVVVHRESGNRESQGYVFCVITNAEIPMEGYTAVIIW
jgi:hypothetical protein